MHKIQGNPEDQSGVKSLLDSTQRQLLSEDRKVPTVWIIGSGYYITGAEYTANRCYGENFGVNAKIHWMGKVSISPDLLVLHVGSNDLGNTNVSDLVSKMVKDLTHLHQAFPQMKIAYSCITPRLAWGAFDPHKINQDRMTVNKGIQSSAGLFNGAVMEHPKLTLAEGHLFKPDLTLKTNKISVNISWFKLFLLNEKILTL
uniref:SGNH hydrolase-type esterase domain-containing protein n=1 Tax=Oryzias latipes TaxID=8090 RepID=A0A3P9J5S4_ORYLA